MLRTSQRWISGAPSSLPGEVLLLKVTGARRPTFRLEAAADYRLRLLAGARPFLWARIDDWWHGAWLVRAPAPPDPLLPPLRAVDARAVQHDLQSPHWWRTWTLRAVDTLRASAALLSNGLWCLGEVPVVPPSKAWGYPCVPVDYALEPAFPPAYVPAARGCLPFVEETWAGGDPTPAGALLPLRDLGAEDVGRVHAWRKHARDGTLPPVLAVHLRLLGKYLILDGHVRLAAALEEGVTPPLLAAWPVREHATPIPEAVRAHVWETLELPASLPDARRVEVMNSALQAVFAPRVAYVHRPKAWPLRGGVATWREEVGRRLRELGLTRQEIALALDP
ncbi:hypothetical protein [Chondromyces apiculatus]|uniref:ParB/Sulfiredoxin domain-containing protein n=1 Tax=Chondromyces apiculatus DSM 436 TaxID=1192034 RepID=A0A017TGX8_9BACT|nr:hypothetical protein [Chondromyces apiculatus]EYF08045.1 Hypothetical protein CAP_5805 [Chondromyces apiculatus DSM 436]